MNRFAYLARSLVVLGAVVSAGCASHYTVTMDQEVEPTFLGSSSPELDSTSYKKAVVVPPIDASRATSDRLIATCEREFIGAGLTLISSDTTSGKSSGEATAAASNDENAALVQLAQNSGAEVIVRVVKYEWSDSPQASRFFTVDPEKSLAFKEVSQKDYKLWNGKKYAFKSPVLDFDFKIIDVSNSQVLGTFEGSAAANFSLPSEYAATIDLDDEGNVTTHSESFKYDDAWWLPKAKENVETRVLRTIAEKIHSDKSSSQ